MLLYTDIELVVKRSKELESRLREELGAQGDGLAALAHSVEGMLPAQTLQQLLDVADMRNKIVHNKNQDILENRDHFVQLCNEIEISLNELRTHLQPRGSGKWGCLVMAIIITAPIICLMMNPS